MRVSSRYLPAIVIMLIALSAVAIKPRGKTEPVAAAPYLYILSPDAGFAAIDLSARRVIANGRLPELRSIERVFANPFSDNVFVQSPVLSDTQGTLPTAQLVELTRSPVGADPALRFARWIHGPTPLSRMLWTKSLSKDRLLMSWQDEHDNVSSVLYDTATDQSLRTIQNFVVRPATCLGSDGQTVYAVSNNPKHEITVLNVKSFEIKASSYEQLGSSTAYYKVPAAADGCLIAFVERIQTPTAASAPATIYVYNVETNATLTRFNINSFGQLALVANRNLILMNVETLAPNTIGGKVIGTRRLATGNVVLYDSRDGNEVARVSVPAEGHLAGISDDGSSLYYLSPKLLTIIDLDKKQVRARIEHPFDHGMLVQQSSIVLWP